MSQCISDYHIYGHWFVEKKFMYFRLDSYDFCISQFFGPAFAQRCAHLPLLRTETWVCNRGLYDEFLNSNTIFSVGWQQLSFLF